MRRAWLSRPVGPPHGVLNTPECIGGLTPCQGGYTPLVGIFEEINKLRAQRARDAAQLDALDDRITQLIRQAVTEGHGPTEIARKIGVTRARVYQILEKKR